MNVRDTELYTVDGRINLHAITKRQPRLTDGVRHLVTVRKVGRREMKKLWR